MFFWSPRTKTRVEIANWSPWDFYGAFDPPATIVQQADDSFDELGLFGGWIRFTTLDRDTMPPNELFQDATDHNISEHDALSRAIQDQFIDEVGPATCKRYLDKAIDEHIECKWDLLQAPLECPANTVAARIESAFYSDENRLDTSLQKAVEGRCSLLDLCLERRDGILAENRRKLFSRWRSEEPE
jgi:hypothetical protein